MTGIFWECNYCQGHNDAKIDLSCRWCGAPRGKAVFKSIVESFNRYKATALETDWSVVGGDVSQWQGTMDWSKYKQKAQYAYIRAGIGNQTFDTKLEANRSGAAQYSVEHGLYWYLKPAADWKKHVANFVIALRSGGWSLPPMIDCEENGELRKEDLNSWIYKLATNLENAIGREVCIYTSKGFWDRYMPITGWAKNRKLVVAHWTNAASPLIPNEWANANVPRTWNMWQYSADGNNKGAEYGAESDDIDLQRYNGTIAQFNAEYNTNIGPINPPDVYDPYDPEWIGTTTANVNLRSGPGTNYGIIGMAMYGSRLPIYRQENNWLDTGGSWVSASYVRK